MEPKWSLFGSQKKDNILTTFLIINLPHFSLSVKWAVNELEMRHKNDNILTTFWQRFDNIFRTFWKWQRFDNILTTFWQHFLKKYLRENELILSCKWAVNYPIGMVGIISKLIRLLFPSILVSKTKRLIFPFDYACSWDDRARLHTKKRA